MGDPQNGRGLRSMAIALLSGLCLLSLPSWSIAQSNTPSAELKRHSTDVIITEPATTISFTPDSLLQLSPNTRHLFHDSFIKVLVRRLHSAHEALAHPRRIF